MSTASEAIAIAAADPTTAYGAAIAAARAAVAVTESTAERVTRLTQELSTAQAELDEAMRPLREGHTTGSAVNFGWLGERIGRLKAELAEAQREATEADTAARREQRAECEAGFARDVDEARMQRAAIRQHYAALARALGAYAGAVQRAITARNALSAGFPDPLRDNALADVANRAALEPLHDLIECGLEPLYDFGFDLRIQVPALREKE